MWYDILEMLFLVILSLCNIFALNNEKNDRLVCYKVLYCRQQVDGRGQFQVQVSLRIDLHHLFDVGYTTFPWSMRVMVEQFIKKLIYIVVLFFFFFFFNSSGQVALRKQEQNGERLEIRNILPRFILAFCVSEWHRKMPTGTSLVVEWLRLLLPMQGTQVPSLVRKLRSHMPWGF